MISTYTDTYHDDVVKLCESFVKESLGEYGFKIEKNILDQTIEVCKQNSLLYVKDGKCVGVIAGHIGHSFTDSEKTFNETIWYMAPEYRKYGVKLYKALEKWCEENGITLIVMALMANSKSLSLDRFYKRLGYQPFEVHYFKRLEGKQDE